MICQVEKSWETIEKSFQRKDAGPTQSFDVLPASFRMPHSFTLTWTSGFHQHEESTLICLKTGSWKGEQVPRGSWQTVLAGCQLQRQLGVLLLLAATVAPRWGLEACALFLNSESRRGAGRGGVGYQGGKSGSHWKLWCHSQICYCSPFDSWGPHLTAEAGNRILFEIRKKGRHGLNFRKCPHDEIWEMATVHNKEVVEVPKLESLRTTLETSPEKCWGRVAFLSGKSMKSP